MVPFTSFPGRELHPSFSPDGTQIAFAWEGENRESFDIYVKLVGEDRPLRLTSSPAHDFHPAWSPDGRHVAFRRAGPLGTEIVLVPALGGVERVITRTSGLPAGRSLSWFPDGAHLAIVDHAAPGAPAALFRVSVRTGERMQITWPPDRTWEEVAVAVSPDGQRLAFVRSESGFWTDPYIYWAPLTPGALEPRRVTAGAAGLWGLAWMPDSRRLAFASQGFRRVTIPGGHTELLPLTGYVIDQPAISRDGRRLAFTSASSDLDIQRIAGPSGPDPVGGAPVTLIASTFMDTNPQYSPDGQRIAFTSTRGGSMQIWVSDHDGTNARAITDFKVNTGSPRWSPDGRFLAFDSTEDGDGNIYVVPAEGGAARRVTESESHEVRASWSRDGGWIYFESNRTGENEIWKTPVGGGPDVQVTWGRGVDAAESHDGGFLYYTKLHERGIWKRPVEGGEEVFVTGRGRPNLWAMHAAGLCTIETAAAFESVLGYFSSSGGTIECLDFADGQWRTVATLPPSTRIHQGGPSMSVSSDGQWVLYVAQTREESDVMLVENFR